MNLFIGPTRSNNNNTTAVEAIHIDQVKELVQLDLVAPLHDLPAQIHDIATQFVKVLLVLA